MIINPSCTVSIHSNGFHEHIRKASDNKRFFYATEDKDV